MRSPLTVRPANCRGWRCPPARGAAVARLCRAHPASVWLVVAENLKAGRAGKFQVWGLAGSAADPDGQGALAIQRGFPKIVIEFGKRWLT